MATKAKKEVAATTKKDAKKVIKKVEVKEPKAKAPKKEAVKKEPKTVKAVPVKEVSKKVVVKKTPKVVEKAEVATSLEVSSEAETPKAEKVVKKEVSKSATTVEELFEAGAHFGHVVKKWNPKMKKYLWGAMNGIHIFDLEQTVSGLNEATKALTELAGSGKRVVLVGTKRQVRQMVEEEAKRLNIPYITQRWIGGLITNWKQVKQTIDRLNSQKLKRETGQLKKYTKKEQVLFDKEIARLERIIGGISALKEAPEVVVVFDTHKEKLAVKEASSRNITVVGIVDSNANPDLVDYIVPMNDDSAKGLEIVVNVFGHAIENGLKSRKEVSK
ncbi:MAG: 30S ribosomal protein S2, small subunit ribosomal protein S2 [Microgenomates group bacterium GW2011_GWC1_44_9]|nr:MAG: 30S ribosomal protein S2, small subunit ribosomal protein S2 [Microgenomates group bacterium GW2011_GWC1_44_9]